MSRRLASLAGLVLVGVVTAAAVPAAVADPGTPRPEADKRLAQRGPQTSDRVPGRLAPYVPRALRKPPVITNDITWAVAPGITFRQWDQIDMRGPNRAYLLTIDPATPGVAIDYASSRSVSKTETVRRMLWRDHAIAGVNGDFYDIFDTGAPLGLGVDRELGILHSRKSGWNRAFLVKDRVPAIANLPMKAKVVQEPWMKITHYNSPTIFDGQIGVYDYRWGNTAGSRVVDGQTEDVRQVVIRDKYVVSNEPTLTNDVPVRGLVLVGRGTGANAVAAASLLRGVEESARPRGPAFLHRLGPARSGQLCAREAGSDEHCHRHDHCVGPAARCAYLDVPATTNREAGGGRQRHARKRHPGTPSAAPAARGQVARIQYRGHHLSRLRRHARHDGTGSVCDRAAEAHHAGAARRHGVHDQGRRVQRRALL